MALGKRVAERQRELRMNQTQLADASGVSQAAISILVKRDSKSSRNLTALANALKVRPQWLETGKGEKEAEPPPDGPVLSQEALYVAEGYDHLPPELQQYLKGVIEERLLMAAPLLEPHYKNTDLEAQRRKSRALEIAQRLARTKDSKPEKTKK